MGSIISAIYDDIKLHGSIEAANAWRNREPEKVIGKRETMKLSEILDSAEVAYLYPHDVDKIKTGSFIRSVDDK